MTVHDFAGFLIASFSSGKLRDINHIKLLIGETKREFTSF